MKRPAFGLGEIIEMYVVDKDRKLETPIRKL